MSPFAGRSRRQISFDGKQLEQWFAAEDGHEVGALIALGLHAEVIGPSAQGEPARTKRGSSFIPDSAPPHALATFEDIYRRDSIPKSKMLYPTTYHDLRAPQADRHGRRHRPLDGQTEPRSKHTAAPRRQRHGMHQCRAPSAAH